jgi:hypothetical protein
MSRAVSADDRTITVCVPWKLKKRGGRKRVICPDGIGSVAEPAKGIDSAMVKALARAFRWRRLLEAGVYGAAAELAGRVLRLTLLAPDLFEAIVDERVPARVGMPELMKPFPANWKQQAENFLVSDCGAGAKPLQ